MDQEIVSRISEIRRQLEAASSERWGNPPQIIAVSKNVLPERVNEVCAAGIIRLGENRAQELVQKLPYLDASFQIDFIGRLQINKVKYIIDKVSMIQSLDREALADEINRRAQQRGIRMPVLVQVNIGRESQKGGIMPEDAVSFVRKISGYAGIEVRGLMAVMPDIDDDDLLRPYFKRMRSLFDMLREEAISNVAMEELSMGMSGDYLLAAQEGSTHVRIGSAIFGVRSQMKAQNENCLKGEKYS